MFFPVLLALSFSNLVYAGPTVKVQFYGESQCPFCREFVTEAWPTVWDDKELMEYVEYDFVAWGNAYFATTKCGAGPYDSQQRACWYQECIIAASDNEEECFGGSGVYQHSKKEGETDIYEMCVKMHAGLEAAVEFTYCCEGPKMDDPSMTAEELMIACLPESADLATISDCFVTQGHEIEVNAAKSTPPHRGVPFVLVNGISVENPLAIKEAICSKLGDMTTDLPNSCIQHSPQVADVLYHDIC